MARPKNRRGKRQQGWQEEEVEAVDDLAVAATFAQVTTNSPAQTQAQEKQRDEDVSSDGDAGSNNVDKEEPNTEASDSSESESDEESVSDEDGDDSESDDDSDVDLAEELARMNDDDDEPPNKSSTVDSQAPKTEHELDPYRTPISDLETKFQLNLTVAEQERLRLDKEATVSTTGPVQLCAAGRIKCHMVEDRTIVVESVATGGSPPLDEGSLLVIRVPNEGDDEVKSRLIPMGKVFEVFGPVSRPLYTVRLPSARDKASKKEAGATKAETNGNIERDADEISLNDDEEAEEQEETKPSSEAVKVPSETDGDNTGQFDPWEPKGEYTLLLEDTKGMAVYYIPDITKLLDTGAVIRNSGRGCDASNLYDEEVVNVNDIAFSDDEEEREFKNRNRRGKKGRRKNDGNTGGGGGRGRATSGSGYTGFHAPQHTIHPSNPPAQYAVPAMNPYQTAPGAYPYQQPYVYPQQPPPYVQAAAPQYGQPYAYPHGAAPPPQYPYPVHPQTHSQWPPNPNQGNGGPPADESSDTVYYD